MKSTSLLKALALLPFVGGSVAVSHAASPLFDLGDNAAAYLLAEAGVTYSDNLFATPDRTDDVTFYITPGLQLNIGDADSANRLTVTAKEKLTAYVDHSDLNSALADVSAVYDYNGQSALRANIYGGFNQLAQNDNTVSVDGDLIKQNIYTGGGKISYDLTAKSTFEIGFDYNQRQFRNYTDRYNDTTSYAIPVSWLYAVTDKLWAGLTYSYTYIDIDQYDNQTVSTAPAWSNIYDPGYQQQHFVGLTARGEVTSKIKLRTNLGVGYMKFEDRSMWDAFRMGPVDDNPSSTTFNFLLAADYQVTDKVVATVTGGRKFEVGGQAQGITNTYVDLGAVYAITQQWEANAHVGYSYQEFKNPDTGTDQITSAGVGISFLPSQYWRISLGYSFQNNHSDRIPGYSINTIALTASVKY